MTSNQVSHVSVTINGLTHHGQYRVESGTVYVESPFGSKASPVGGLPPEDVARLLLSELVRGR